MGKRNTTMAAMLLLVMILSMLAPGILVPVGAETVFNDDFESGAGDWTHGGAQDEWELGTPTVGPGYCHSGSKCWGTDLDDDYNNESNSFLKSPAINLTGAQTAVLEFYHWYDLFAFIFVADFGYVEISTNDGVDYTKLLNVTGDGGELDWHKVTINISAYVGGYVVLRFRLNSDSIWTTSGWFIDDMKVTVDEVVDFDIHDVAIVGIEPSQGPPTVGKALKLTVAVKNQGDFKESDITVSLTIKDPDNGATVYSDSKKIDSMDIGDLFNTAFVWTPQEAGMFIIEAKADLAVDDDINNNYMMRRIRVEANDHDVAIDDLYIDPKSPTVGTVATLTVLVKNIGGVKEEDLKVTLNIHDSSDTAVIKEAQFIDILDVGETKTLEFTWKPDKADTYEARARVELEKDATQNNNKATITIIVPAPGYDMAVTAVAVMPDDTGPGIKRTLSAEVLNAGSLTTFDVQVTYEILYGTGVVDSGGTKYDQIDVEKKVEPSWDFTPEKDGSYTAKVKVSVNGDTNTANDERAINFIVPKVERDVGIESLSVIPRTGDLGVKRLINAKVGNYGDQEEQFVTRITVTDPSDNIVLSKDIDVILIEGDTIDVNTEYTPTVYGNHTVDSKTILLADNEPFNDHSDTFFVVSSFTTHDLGLEMVDIEERKGGLVERIIEAEVRNLGTTSETGATLNLEIRDVNGTLSHTNQTAIPTLQSGGNATLVMSYTPVLYGEFKAKVWVDAPEDDLPENDMVELVFWVVEPGFLLYDLGIEGLDVDPRTDVLVERALLVTVGNYGWEVALNASLMMKVVWPGHEEEVFNGSIPQAIGSNHTYLHKEYWTPPGLGTYNLTARVTLDGDSFSANDEATIEFIAIELSENYDLGIEDLRVEPRTDFTDVERAITVSIMNHGDHEATGIVGITVRAPDLLTILDVQETVTVPAGGVKQVEDLITPESIGEYVLRAEVTVQNHTDVEPANDLLDMTFIAKEPPPPPPLVDVEVVEIEIDPDPGMTGLDLQITATVRNHGTMSIEGMLLFNVTDPDGKVTQWDRRASLGPKDETNSTTTSFITLNPVKAGLFKVKVRAMFPLDTNIGNDEKEVQFNIYSGGGRDATVESIDVVKQGSCSMKMDVKATVANIGTVSLGQVKVELEVRDGGGVLVHNDTVMVELGRNASIPVSFAFTAGSPGRYQFEVQVTADGDEVPTNDVKGLWATACDPTKTDVGTDVATCLPFVAVPLVLLVVFIFVYNVMYARKREMISEGKGLEGMEGSTGPGPMTEPKGRHRDHGRDRAGPKGYSDRSRARGRTRGR